MKNNDQNLELKLLDKCTFQSLKDEELEIVSKHKLLVPDIFLIENLKRPETINKLSKLKSIYRIEHWSILAKNDLLGLLGQRITVTQEDLRKITNDPAELKKQVALAKKTAKGYDNLPKKLLQNAPDLSSKSNMNWIIKKIRSGIKTYRPDIKITDQMIGMVETKFKQNKSLFTALHNDWEYLSQLTINDLDNKPIRPENRYLKESERAYIRNKERLDFVCTILQTTKEEKTQIFKRWEKKYHQHLKYFAPYAYYVLALELTIAFHIIKSKGSYKQEIMRDLEYLHYANCTNVTFHTCDRQLKDTIQKISFLTHIQEKMVYFYNDKENRPGELNKSDWLQMLKDRD